MNSQLKDNKIIVRLHSDKGNQRSNGFQIKSFLAQSKQNTPFLNNFRKSFNGTFERYEQNPSILEEKNIDSSQRAASQQSHQEKRGQSNEKKNSFVQRQQLSLLLKKNTTAASPKYLFGSQQQNSMNLFSNSSSQSLLHTSIIGKSLTNQSNNHPLIESQTSSSTRYNRSKDHMYSNSEIKSPSKLSERLSICQTFNKNEENKTLDQIDSQEHLKTENITPKKIKLRESILLKKFQQTSINYNSEKGILSSTNSTKNQNKFKSKVKILHFFTSKGGKQMNEQEQKIENERLQRIDFENILTQFDKLKVNFSFLSQDHEDWLIERLEDLNQNNIINFKKFTNFVSDILQESVLICISKGDYSSPKNNETNDSNPNNKNTNNKGNILKRLSSSQNQGSLLNSSSKKWIMNLVSDQNLLQDSSSSYKLSEEIISKLCLIISESIALFCKSSSSKIVLQEFEQMCKNKFCQLQSDLLKFLSLETRENILINTLSYLNSTSSIVSVEKLQELKVEIQNFWSAVLSENSLAMLTIIKQIGIKGKVNFTDFFLLKLSLIQALNTETYLDYKLKCKIIKKLEKIRVLVFPSNFFGTNELILKFKEIIFKSSKCISFFKESDNNFSNSVGRGYSRNGDLGINDTKNTNQMLSESKSTQCMFSSANNGDSDKWNPSKSIKLQNSPTIHLQRVAQNIIFTLNGKKSLFSLLSYLKRHFFQIQSPSGLKECSEIIKEISYELLNKTCTSPPTLQLKDLEYKMIFLQHLGDLTLLENTFSEVSAMIIYFKKWVIDKLNLSVDQGSIPLFNSDSPYFLFFEYLIISLSSKEELYSVYDIDAAKKYFKIDSYSFKLLLSELTFFLLNYEFPKQHIKMLITYLQKYSLVL